MKSDSQKISSDNNSGTRLRKSMDKYLLFLDLDLLEPTVLQYVSEYHPRKGFPVLAIRSFHQSIIVDLREKTMSPR